jgi:hypothetical protein
LWCPAAIDSVGRADVERQRVRERVGTTVVRRESGSGVRVWDMGSSCEMSVKTARTGSVWKRLPQRQGQERCRSKRIRMDVDVGVMCV